MKSIVFLALILSAVLGRAQESLTPTAGLAIVNSCSGGVVRFKTAKSGDRALVATNGHCLLLNMTFGRPLPYPAAGEIMKDVTDSRFLQATSIRLFTSDGEMYVQARRLVYATMTGTDVALFELPYSYRELASWGVPAHTVASRAPMPGEKIEIRSGYFGRRFKCRFEGLRTVLEGPFFFSAAQMYSEECAVYPGYSGSLILSRKTGEVLGLANTHSWNESANCGFDHPCFFVQESQSIAAIGAYKSFGVPLINLPQEKVTLPLFKAASALTAEEMKVRLERFAEFARPQVRAVNAELVMALEEDWVELPGHSGFDQGTLTITVGARLYENPRMTGDSLDAILCHELGHFLGEAPKKKNAMNNSGDWASAEGESDYFAGQCLVNLWKRELNPDLIFTGWETESRCEGLQSLVQSQVCERAGQAGTALFRMFYDVYKASGSAIGPRPDIHTHDATEVPAYLFDYPSYQCRLDTLIAGVLQAARPRCWHYK